MNHRHNNDTGKGYVSRDGVVEVEVVLALLTRYVVAIASYLGCEKNWEEGIVMGFDDLMNGEQKSERRSTLMMRATRKWGVGVGYEEGDRRLSLDERQR